MNALAKRLIHLAYYPSVGFNRFMCLVGFWNPWDWADEFVLLGAVPSRADIKTLHGLGIRSIVNLCEEFAGHLDEMAAVGMRHFHIPVVDYHCPNEADLLRGVQILLEEAGERRKTFVHCKAGQGRGPTLVMCYLMAGRGMSASEAYTYLKTIRPHLTRRLDRRTPVLAIAERLRKRSVLA